MTPPEYWAKKGLESIPDRGGRAAVPGIDGVDALTYSDLTGLPFLVAGKADLDKTHFGPFSIKGNFARVVVSSTVGINKFKRAYFLQKNDGKWTIFMIDMNWPNERFPD